MKIDDVHYENIEKRISINLINNEESTYCLWLEKGEAVLEFELNHKEKNIIKISGRIGEVIKNANLPEDVQVSRCVEALENGLWDYHHPQDNKKRTIGLK